MKILLSPEEGADMIACELVRRMSLREVPNVSIGFDEEAIEIEITAEVPAPTRDLRDGRT